MKVGIVGFPGSGKTTVFNALTGLKAQSEPGASGERGLCPQGSRKGPRRYGARVYLRGGRPLQQLCSIRKRGKVQRGRKTQIGRKGIHRPGRGYYPLQFSRIDCFFLF